MKWNVPFPTVKTYSVFDKTGPVLRLITIGELMDIYDIELLSQGELKRFWKAQSVKPTRSFAQQIPIKVLRSIASRIVDKLADNVPAEDVMSVSSIDSNCTLKCGNLFNKDTSNTGESDDESIANELLLEHPAFSNATEKAACSDDKEAEASDWDIWTVLNFKTDIESKGGIICTGKYVPAIHEPFFNSFRNLLIRRYRRNVLRSFLR